VLQTVSVSDRKTRKQFLQFYNECYSNSDKYRSSSEFLTRFFLDKSTTQGLKTKIVPCIILDGDKMVARYMIIRDRKFPGTLFISFFESLDRYPLVVSLIEQRCNQLFGKGNICIFGINGHFLLYSGFSTEKRSEIPVFGVPFTHDYYHKLFSDYEAINLNSYRLSLSECTFDTKSFDLINSRKGLVFSNNSKKTGSCQCNG
jgi:hypothetical protein